MEDIKEGEYVKVDGKIGKVVGFCHCKQCKERGYFEPIIDNPNMFITIHDKNRGFEGIEHSKNKEDLEDIKEKTADEMFEKLGYEKMESSTEIVYEIDKLFIVFNKSKQGIGFIEKRKCIDGYMIMGTQHIQAINKKCKELGWI